MGLYQIKPQLDTLLELFVGLVLGLVLHIQHGWQVAILQLHVLDEELGLILGWRVDTVEVIGTTGETILAGLVEIFDEILVNLRRTFRSLNHNEAHGKLVYGSLVLQRLPVYLSLVVADINAVYFVALGVADVAIERTEAKAERTDEEEIEEIDVDSQHSSSAHPPCPAGHVL